MATHNVTTTSNHKSQRHFCDFRHRVNVSIVDTAIIFPSDAESAISFPQCPSPLQAIPLERSASSSAGTLRNQATFSARLLPYPTPSLPPSLPPPFLAAGAMMMPWSGVAGAGGRPWDDSAQQISDMYVVSQQSHYPNGKYMNYFKKGRLRSCLLLSSSHTLKSATHTR